MLGPTSEEIQIYLYQLMLNGVKLVRNKLKMLIIFVFSCFMIFMNDDETKCFHADVGDTQHGGSYPMHRRVGALFVHRGDDELTELEENLN